jgi:hypothetical protein
MEDAVFTNCALRVVDFLFGMMENLVNTSLSMTSGILLAAFILSVGVISLSFLKS